MLKIQMARCYPHMDNSSVLNGIITDVEKHYNKMVEVVTKIEEAITSLKVSAGGHITEISELKNICEESEKRITKLEKMANTTPSSVDELSWVKKEKQLDDDFDKEMRKLNEEYDQKLVFEKMANTTSATVDCDKFNLVSENMRLKEENKKLREENIKLKQSQNSASNEEINRMIDSTINIMKAWNIQREGAK